MPPKTKFQSFLTELLNLKTCIRKWNLNQIQFVNAMIQIKQCKLKLLVMEFFKSSNSNVNDLNGVMAACFSVSVSYLVSSATSTSAGAVMGALECPAVGSSVFSSPFVELITCRKE